MNITETRVVSYREKVIEQDRIARELQPPIAVHEYGLGSNFRKMKSRLEIEKILAERGLGPQFNPDPEVTQSEVKELLFEDAQADEEGNFTFPSRRVVLGHTAEDISVPTNEQHRMRAYFVLKKTREMTHLTTNLGAPTLHPGSKGPQTYEIYNEEKHSLTVNINDLICFVDVFKMDDHILEGSTSVTFGNQTRGAISLGK